MRRGVRVAVALAAMAVMLACVGPRSTPGRGDREADRLDHLERGLALRRRDPSAAAAEFRAAGPGSALERLRLQLWVDALERGAAPPASWREVVREEVPADLAGRSLIGLASSLRAVGELAAADEVLEGAAAADRDLADEWLLASQDAVIRTRAARRLAVSAPARLHSADRPLEASVTNSLSPDEWIRRSAAWRGDGSPGIAVSELRRLRFRGADETARVRELARAELAVGRSSRVLALLSGPQAADSEARLLRARAERLRGWSRFPDGAWRSAFRACAREATAAAAHENVPDDLRRDALEVLVECATENGELEDAFNAWRSLESMAWEGERRGWLGRRLGVALARDGDRPRALAIASALPDHERCLRYWAADGDPRVLARLAAGEVDDLYRRWARQDLGLGPSPPPSLRPEVAPAQPPPSVVWLLDRGEQDLALREWARLRQVQRPTPAEAIAAADLAESMGRRHEAIGWLRAGIRELGGIETMHAPGNAVRAYLPLPWPDELRSAAGEVGLPPWIVAGVARQESTFMPSARSAAGATGLLQLMAGTAAGHARALGLGRPDLTDPVVNLRLGARELAALIGRLGGLEPALAAYNAGESRVRRWSRAWPDARILSESIPIPETYGYVRRVVFLGDAYRLAWADVWKETP